MSVSPQSYSLVINGQHTIPHAVATAAELDSLYRKLSWRLMPLFCMVIVLNYLDRTSLAFASIQMTAQLKFSPGMSWMLHSSPEVWAGRAGTGTLHRTALGTSAGCVGPVPCSGCTAQRWQPAAQPHTPQ